MEKKMTYVEALTIAIEAMEADVTKAEAVERLKAMKATQEKKSGKTSKAELAKKELNETLRTQIAEAMADGVGRTITEMIKGFDFLADYSVSKVSAICRPLIEDGTLVKETIKGKSVYSVSAEVVEE